MVHRFLNLKFVLLIVKLLLNLSLSFMNETEKIQIKLQVCSKLQV